MNTDLDMISFGMIADASESRSLALEAVSAARKGDYTRCEECLAKSRKAYDKTHRAQTDVLFEEMNGKTRQVNVLLVHSQDHLSSASVVLELAEQMISLIKTQTRLEERTSRLEKRLNELEDRH
ncbi:MAG: PTS lactose/cellobiose transporter subunit IIA [Allobaculum sp.]|uniref:PTS lactose/cellobiose transporter subunit IIA n=1 Tax=Allobaculum sp. TaxID=1872463 RepID=UPI00399BF5E0